jgi:hypothetical protein
MGLHMESANAKENVLEAEMRRRLWWALVVFDARVSEMSDSKASILVPTWDCKIPSNVNDFDLRPEMKIPPPSQTTFTEATFAVVRAEMADFLRYSVFNIDYTNPALRPLAKEHRCGSKPEDGELVVLEKMIEGQYLQLCNPENPLHFMTIWSSRWYLAKHQLLEHYSRYSRSSVQQTDAQRDAALCYAMNMLACDTKVITSPITKGYFWHINTVQFPFQAYVHVIQDLRKRPFGQHAGRAWQVLSESYEARFKDMDAEHDHLLKILSKVVFQAWAAREGESGGSAAAPQGIPGIVSTMRQKLTQAQNGSTEQQHENAERIDSGEVSMPEPLMDIGSLPGSAGPFGILWADSVQAGMGGGFSQASGVDVNQLDWTAMDWNPMRGQGWQA